MASFTDFAAEYRKKKKKGQTFTEFAEEQTGITVPVVTPSVTPQKTVENNVKSGFKSDIAPVKTTKSSESTKQTTTSTNKVNYFADGYDFGDVSRTILGVTSSLKSTHEKAKAAEEKKESAFDEAMTKKYSSMSLSDLEKNYARIEKEEKEHKEKNGGKIVNTLTKVGSYLTEGQTGQSGSSTRAKSQANIDKIDDLTREKEILNTFRKKKATEEYLGGLDDKQLKMLDNIAEAKDLENAAPFSILAPQGGMDAATYNKITEVERTAGKESREKLYNQLKKKNPKKSDEEINELIDNMVELRRSQVNAQEREKEQAEFQKAATEYPVASFLLSRGANLLSGAGLVEPYMQRGNEYGLDTNAPGFAFANASADIDQQIQLDHSWKIGNVDAFDLFYEVGAGMVDNIGRLAVAGGNPTASGAIMFSQVATQGIIEGKEKGYSDEKALTMGLLQGTFEAISEKMGLDYILGSGGGALKKLAKSFVAEGAEEVTSSWLNRIADQIANGKHSDLSKQYEAYINEGLTPAQAMTKVVGSLIGEDVKSFVVSGLSGLGVGGVAAVSNAVASKNAPRQLTEKAQTVVDKVVDDIINEEKESGNKVSKGKEKKIRDEVIQAMDKGYLDTDKIESILGGEEFEAYKAEKDKIDGAIADGNELLKNLRETLKTLEDEGQQAEIENRIQRTKDILEKLKNNENLGNLKAKLGQNVFEMVKDTELAESYYEIARHKQNLSVDIEQYENEYAKKTVQNALDYRDSTGHGLDNTNASHDFIDLMAKYAAERKAEIVFTTTEGLAELKKNGNKYGIGGDINKIDAFVSKEDKKVFVNMDTGKNLYSVVGHEFGHIALDANSIKKLNGVIKAYLGESEYKKVFDKKSETYEVHNLTEGELIEELVVDFCGERFLTDYDFVMHLATNDQNIFQKAWDSIKYLYKLATAGSKEARQLEKAKRIFEKAYRETAKLGAKSEGGTKLSISGVKSKTADKSLLSQAEQMLDSGVDSETIRKETGWYRGYDGQWRFEIDDSKFEFYPDGKVVTPEILRARELQKKISDRTLTEDELEEFKTLYHKLDQSEVNPMTLGKMVEHKELFDAYPQLEKIRLSFADLSEHTDALYDMQQKTIKLNSELQDDDERVKTALIHEIQHAIQDIEGFANGSSVEYWKEQRADIVNTLGGARRNLDLWLDDIGYSEFAKKSMQEVVDRKKTIDEHWEDCKEFKENSKYAEQIANCEREIAEYQQQYDEITNGMTAYEQYQNTAGEIEARDTENRLTLNAEERKNKRPDIDRENVVFADAKYSLSETDNKYLDAVNRGDTETAQRMVDEVARKNGYTIKAYHGTPNNDFTVFDKGRVGKGIDQYGAGFYFATNSEAARGYGNRVIDSTLSIKNPLKIDASTEDGANLIDGGFDHLLTKKQAYEVIKRLPNIYDSEESILGDYYDTYWETGAEDWMIRDLASNESYRNIGYLDSDLFRDYPNELHEALRDVVGYDGVEVTFDNGDKFYVAWFDNQMKSADTVTYDDDGNVIPLSKRFNAENNDIRYSLSEDELRNEYEGFNDIKYNYGAVKSHKESLAKKITVDSSIDLDTINQRYDKIIGIWDKLGGELNSKFLNDWNNKTDRQFTIFKAQAGYKYNAELSSMCKKGVPLFEAIDTIVKKEVMKELDLDVIGKEEKEILYDILKQHSFEIPCAICYVEQARQREGIIIDAFLNGNDSGKLGWNKVLDSVEAEMSANGFLFKFPNVSRDIATDKYNAADITMDEATAQAFYSAVQKIANQEIKRYNKEEKKNRKLLKNTTPEAVNECFKGTLPANLKIFKTLLSEPSSRFRIENDLLYSSMTTRNLSSSHHKLYSLFNSQGGVSGYKTKQGTTIYWGEILGKKWTPQTTRKEGGVRGQSNSDSQAFTILDQAQMYIDYTAKGLYLQEYTKVISKLKLFGLSKSKINASLIPKVKVYRDANGNVDVQRTRENAGLDENGNLIFDDFEGINHKEAFMLLEDAEYSKNICGICIGYSDKHILKLLDDNRVQQIIGYHDKTNDPDKRYPGARYAKNYNGLNEVIDNNGKTKHINFNPFVIRAEKRFTFNSKTESFEGKTTFNGKEYTANDIPRLAADMYLDMCNKKGYTPAYDDFKWHPNYYKLLADFGLYDSQGNYAPHRKVEYNMPDTVPYLDENGNKKYMSTEAYIKAELQKELAVRDSIAEALSDTSENGIIPQFKAAIDKRNNLKYSLSEEGETRKNYGKLEVYAKDITMQGDIAPTVSETEQVGTVNENDYAPMTEAEAVSMMGADKDYINSFTDADMPPEIDAPIYSADATSLDKKTLSNIANTVRDALSLSRVETKAIQDIIQKYSTSEQQSEDDLFKEIKAQFGEKSWEEKNEEIAQVKQVLRGCRVNVSPTIKRDIPDYAQFRKRNFGKITFAKDGMDVDKVYMTLSDYYPSLFPKSIGNATDQLLRMSEVANMNAYDTKTDMLDDETIQEAAELIVDVVSTYKEKELLKFTEAQGKEFLKNANKYEKEMPVINNDVAPIRKVDVPTPTSEVKESATPTESNNAETKPTRRSELHNEIVEGIKTKFAEKGFDFDEVLSKAKNLSTFATVDNIPQRVMEKALGYKQGQALADETVNKVAQNESEGIKWLNSFTDRKNGILAQISKQYNIKPGSKKSAAAQMYAEGFYVGKNNEIIEYGDRELAIDFPDAKVQANIKGLANDPRIRQIYDETLNAINESRRRNLYPEIQRLDNYFLHFRAMEDTFSRLGLPFNPNDIRAKDLPTDLNGVTADLKPGQPYFASAKHREGMRTSFDLLGGLERYLSSAKNQIYHIDDIQTLRALRNYIADTYGQAKGLESLDDLTEEEAQERIEQVYGSHLSTFAKFLNEEANVLAGKTTLIDRGLEGVIGRRGITFLNTVNGQVGSNMVGWNFSSSLTNILPVVQTMAKTNKFDFVKALAQTSADKISSLYGKSDGFKENSPVIIRRKGAERFYRTPFQKVGDAGYILMSAVDDVSTEIIARTKYNELTRKGMDSQQAHFETDKWVSRLMGDRSLGQQPQLYNSKMLGLVTKFQLEVRNQLDSQFYDTIQEAKVSNEEIENTLLRNAKTAAKVGSTFFQLAALQHIFGAAFEAVAGYNPAFDIIDVLIKTLGLDDDEDDEDTPLDNLEEGFLTLLEDLPYTSTLTGGRIPISSGLPVTELIKGKDQYGNEVSRLDVLKEAAPYYILPTGYGQIKKTAKGLGMFSDDHPVAGSYTDSGSLRFPVEETPLNVAQAAIFGQYANKNARTYFDEDYAPLKEKQIEEYAKADMPIADYWKYREGLKDLSTQDEKAAYINGLDISKKQKDVLKSYLYDEEGYKKENPEKYAFLEREGIGYLGYKELDEDTQSAWSWAFKHQDEYEYYKENGVLPGDYSTYYIPMLDFEDEGDEAYSWAFDNPEKATLGRVFTDGVKEYRQYSADLNEIKADKDSNGKTIRGSEKEKKKAYIWSLPLDYGQKAILYRSLYDSEDDRATYNQDIIDYLISRDDITYDEMNTICEELGFTVNRETGYISWD